jgi:hypothetical protein
MPCGLARAAAGLWLCSLSIGAASGSDVDFVGVEDDEAPAIAVFAKPTAPPAPVNSSRFFWASGSNRRSFLDNRSSFLSYNATNITGSGGFLEERRLQQTTTPTPNLNCRKARRPGTYGRIELLPPARITECVRYPSKAIFGVNAVIVDMSYGQFGKPGEELEALLLSQKRASTHYLEVTSSGDFVHFDVRNTNGDMAMNKKFSDTSHCNDIICWIGEEHSCLNQQKWCFIAQVKPVEEGLLVVDRHRLISYNYSWLVDGNTPASQIPKVYTGHFGFMNVNRVGANPNTSLYFPTAVEEYRPHNDSFVAPLEGYNITSEIPHAADRLLFVADTGNHRVVILNSTAIGQFDYLGQFGETGVAKTFDDVNDTVGWKTGLNWPMGIAVKTPAIEGLYEPTYANVFVVDRRNHRLVKLNLGYPLVPCEAGAPEQTGPLVYNDEEKVMMCRRYDRPTLSFSAQYGREPDELNRPRGLTDPVAVGIYRHYIAVCEVGGNAVTLLTLEHTPPFALKYVTYFKPVNGVSLRGSMAVSPFGYIWYNYIGNDNNFYFGSMLLPESLQHSKAPSRLADFLSDCVNKTWYDNLISNMDMYLNHTGFILNTTLINWRDPSQPDFLDVFSFNVSYDEGFTYQYDMALLKTKVFDPYNSTYNMTMCVPPTTPAPQALMSGNAEGWVIDGMSQSQAGRRSSAPRSSHLHIALVAACMVLSSLVTTSRP